MNSFNHYSLGSVGEWLYRSVAGLDADPAVPGFERVRIAPVPDQRLDWAEARYHGIRGPIRTRWQRTPESFRLDVEIPANSGAEVTIPNPLGAPVREGGTAVGEADGVTAVATRDGTTVVRVGSGSYRFTVA